MTDNWTDRISEYVDGGLTPAEHGELDRHLMDCAACRTVLADLRRVVERARALEDRAPARDLWAGIAGRIGATPGTAGLHPGSDSVWRRRFTFTVPQLAAAAAVLVVLAAALSTRLLDRTAPATIATGEQRLTVGLRIVPVTTPRLDAAVADLEQALRDGRGRLDSATVLVIEKNLAIIDTAIAEAYAALERDPSNAFLNRHLTSQKLRKLDLLRRANELAAART